MAVESPRLEAALLIHCTIQPSHPLSSPSSSAPNPSQHLSKLGLGDWRLGSGLESGQRSRLSGENCKTKDSPQRRGCFLQQISEF